MLSKEVALCKAGQGRLCDAHVLWHGSAQCPENERGHDPCSEGRIKGAGYQIFHKGGLIGHAHTNDRQAGSGRALRPLRQGVNRDVHTPGSVAPAGIKRLERRAPDNKAWVEAEERGAEGNCPVHIRKKNIPGGTGKAWQKLASEPKPGIPHETHALYRYVRAVSASGAAQHIRSETLDTEFDRTASVVAHTGEERGGKTVRPG